MRWPSSRSNRAREEMAMTRQFSRLSAMGGFPIQETLQQGEIERHSNTPRLKAAHERRVALQLRRVARAFLLQECIYITTMVTAGLVVDDPAHVVLVHEGAVDDTGLQAPVAHGAQGVLA